MTGSKAAESPPIPQDLVDQMVEALERESSEDWTREFGASGAKTSPPP